MHATQAEIGTSNKRLQNVEFKALFESRRDIEARVLNKRLDDLGARILVDTLPNTLA